MNIMKRKIITKFVSNGPINSLNNDKDLDSARNNLTDLLKGWNNSNQNDILNKSPSNNSSLTINNSHIEYDEEYNQVSSSFQKLKRSKGHRKSKKRLSEDEFVHHSSFMLKLFERQVDLAQFKDNAPLYTLCRAWVKNPTDQSKNSDSESDDLHTSDSMETDEKDNFIFELPAPIPSDRDLRIPKNLKKPKTSSSAIDKSINSLVNEKLNVILELNKKRWKEVRKEWRKASLENEARYKKSCDILKEMYERTITSQNEAEI